MFNRQQYIIIVSAVLLVFAIYLGCDRVPKNHKSKGDDSVSLPTADAEIGAWIAEAKAKLSPEMSAKVSSIEQQIKISSSDTAKSNLMKQLSSVWYSQEKLIAAGYYANQIAAIDKTEKGWNIAGSTLFEAIRASDDTHIKQYCSENAVKAYEKAIAIAPQNVDYQIALALCYTEFPPQDNPMKGILQLRDLDTKFPNNAKVLFQLAKLAMRTNQYDKAVTRLEQILKTNPNNPDAICLISDAYRGQGNEAKAKVFTDKCQNLFKK
jgi:tetratricopeptide (TPR) repeat protein